MAIIQSINSVYQFEAAFKYAGRVDQFSWTALKALFEYLENLSEDIGENIDLDVVAICCEYSEEHYKDVASNYNIDLSDAEDEEKAKRIVIDYLEENCGFACECDAGNILYQVF